MENSWWKMKLGSIVVAGSSIVVAGGDLVQLWCGTWHWWKLELGQWWYSSSELEFVMKAERFDREVFFSS
jgi:hypothetical protein